MPATFAHPVFAIPLRHLGLPLSALCVGSMVPDLAYVLPFGGRYTAHGIIGLFVFSLPAGLATWGLFQLLVVPALQAWVPRPWALRLAEVVRAVDWRSPALWGRAACAVFLGAATHVGIDEFTHRSGWAIQTWPDVFKESRYRIPGLTTLPLFKLLQYSAGLGGTAVLGICVMRWARRGPRLEYTPDDRRRVGQVLLAIAMLGVLSASRAAWVASHLQEAGFRLHVFAVQTAAGGLVLTALLLLAFGVLHRIRR